MLFVSICVLWRHTRQQHIKAEKLLVCSTSIWAVNGHFYVESEFILGARKYKKKAEGIVSCSPDCGPDCGYYRLRCHLEASKRKSSPQCKNIHWHSLTSAILIIQLLHYLIRTTLCRSLIIEHVYVHTTRRWKVKQGHWVGSLMC